MRPVVLRSGHDDVFVEGAVSAVSSCSGDNALDDQHHEQDRDKVGEQVSNQPQRSVPWWKHAWVEAPGLFRSCSEVVALHVNEDGDHDGYSADACALLRVRGDLDDMATGRDSGTPRSELTRLRRHKRSGKAPCETPTELLDAEAGPAKAGPPGAWIGYWIA